METKMSAHDFEKKYNQYKTTLFRISFTYLKDENVCEDVLQEVFYKLLTNKGSFENEEHEKRWLIRVTVNLCKNHLKSFWNKKKTHLEEILDIVTEPEDRGVLSKVLELPDKYKAVIYLHCVEGYKCNEIAEILQLKGSESAVKMRLKKGREMLKVQMDM